MPSRDQDSTQWLSHTRLRLYQNGHCEFGDRWNSTPSDTPCLRQITALRKVSDLIERHEHIGQPPYQVLRAQTHPLRLSSWNRLPRYLKAWARLHRREELTSTGSPTTQ